MNVPIKGGLARSPQDVAQSMERLATAVSVGWNVEHRPDGRHAFRWVDVPFTGSLYGAQAGTWTVTSETQTVAQYSMRGDTMRLQLEILGSSVSTTPTYLSYLIPNGKRAARRSGGPVMCNDNGTARCVWWLVLPGRRDIRFYRDMSGTVTYAAAASTTSLAADMEFEVQ